MKRRFKPKRQRPRLFKIKYLLYILFVIISYQITIDVFMKMKLTASNEQFLLAMMHDSNHYIKYVRDSKNIINASTSFITGINIDTPVETLKNVFHYNDSLPNKSVINKESDSDNSEIDVTKTKYISNPKKETVVNPRVYIYNTHQLENYSMKNLEVYNITPNVMMASYLLREKLNNYKIETVVEESNVLDYINLNNWSGKDSYRASRVFMSRAISKYQNLDLLVDIHRDSITKSQSTININAKNYAKVLFVIGLNNKNYQANLDIALKVSNLINSKYPGLSRGVLKKEGSNVNGVYNQDVSPKTILIECGGYENSIDEVSNTIEVLATSIKEYLGKKDET